MASRTPSPLVHPAPDDFDLFKVMGAPTDDTRLAIALATFPGPASSGFRQDVTASILTRHFRGLREAGLIQQRDVGTRQINRLREEELDQRFPGLLDLALTESAARVMPRPNTADA
ncbi:ArsR/SmtB family transcription factor [Streptomyces sp. NPDC096310]|uniref:ArsR/SmtB family transcription factor n=1 Tax=Streptomyces sp. NPDC096310 TaxID=3366082 RepID=UPI00380E8607